MERSLHLRVATALANVEIGDDSGVRHRIDAVRHTGAARRRLAHQRDDAARRTGDSAVIGRSLPEPTAPPLDERLLPILELERGPPHE
jgi:hypothetical protein